MRRYLLLLVLLLSVAPRPLLHGMPDPTCERATPADLTAFKESYEPVVFAPEPLGLEVADLVVLAALLLIGAYGSLTRRSPRCMTALMGVGVGYFGLLRGGCVCPVGAVSNVTLGLASPALVGKLVAVLFLMPLLCAFLFGRIFCSSACPLGALQQLLSRRRRAPLPRQLHIVLRVLPVGVLFLTAWGVLRGGLFLACRLDVYRLVFFTGHAWVTQLAQIVQGALTEPRLLLVGDLAAWLTLGAALVLGLFVPRPFCRFLCPYGVLLGVISTLGLRRRRIDAGCYGCGRCKAVCPVQAIAPRRGDTRLEISTHHCIQCGRCDEACKGNCISG